MQPETERSQVPSEGNVAQPIVRAAQQLTALVLKDLGLKQAIEQGVGIGYIQL